MNITEEQKQEADRVVEMYLPMVNPKDFFGDSVEMRNGINCAIQDRQSVLDKTIFQKETFDNYLSKRIIQYLEDEIQSLNAQIDYLKSKI